MSVILIESEFYTVSIEKEIVFLLEYEKNKEGYLEFKV